MTPSDPASSQRQSLLAEESQSDHMTLLRAFQRWQESGEDSGDFCTSHGLSSAALESIFNARSLLLGHLRASGFVRAKAPGDIKDLNVNSENWAVVKAALAAGMYPNVAFRLNNGQLCAHKFGPVDISETESVVGPNNHEWFLYEDIKVRSVLTT